MLLISISVVVAAFFVDPIAQDPAYHRFVDQRRFLSIANTLNLVSNLPFVIVGVAGLLFVKRHGSSVVPHTQATWLVFFVGVLLTAFGSGYYHLAPNNETLIWDRLPMTIGFMSFVAIVIGEYVSVDWGKRLVLPLVITGAASVLYWSHTEQLGAGDLRPYVLVQFMPMVFVPVVILVRRDRSNLGWYIAWMIAFYAMAKVLEYFDAGVFSIGELMSGHALKHVFAALGPAALLSGLMKRTPVTETSE